MSEIPTLDRVWIQNWGGDEPTWQDEQIFGEFDDCPDLEFINIAAYDAQAEHIAELEAEATWQIGGPPDGELVLVSVHYKHRAGSMWDYYRVLEARWECGKGWREAGGLQIRGHRDVTHWRPLPAPVIPEAHDDEAT